MYSYLKIQLCNLLFSVNAHQVRYRYYVNELPKVMQTALRGRQWELIRINQQGMAQLLSLRKRRQKGTNNWYAESGKGSAPKSTMLSINSMCLLRCLPWPFSSFFVQGMQNLQLIDTSKEIKWAVGTYWWLSYQYHTQLDATELAVFSGCLKNLCMSMCMCVFLYFLSLIAYVIIPCSWHLYWPLEFLIHQMTF